jgi:hypothetical protein
MLDDWTSWADLALLDIPCWAHYLTIHVPWDTSEFPEEFTYRLAREPCKFGPMDVEFSTRQTANITLGRKSLVQVLLKIYLLALSEVTGCTRRIPHVDLMKYHCKMMDHWCQADSMIPIMANLMWLYGIKT